MLGSRDAIATSIALCTTSMPENDEECNNEGRMIYTWSDIQFQKWLEYPELKSGSHTGVIAGDFLLEDVIELLQDCLLSYIA